MADSKVALANLALAKIGAKLISSFSEDSDEARIISAVYDDMRNEVLAEHPWSFALVRKMLTLSADVPAFTTDGLSVVYTKPNDLIKVFFVSIPFAIVSVEGPRILSNCRNLGIKYVFKNDNPETYFPQFTTALATRIASEICFDVTESRTKAKDLFEEYEKVRLPRAKESDSQQGTPTPAIQDEWFNSRVEGSFAGPINAGQQTWHPLF